MRFELIIGALLFRCFLMEKKHTHRGTEELGSAMNAGFDLLFELIFRNGDMGMVVSFLTFKQGKRGI
jgi:hypothetical protein